MILVIANYRTGSTTFCKELAEVYGYANFGERFNPSFDEETLRNHFSQLNDDQHNIVIKLMPNQITRSIGYIPNFLQTIVDKAEKVYYTTRLDLDAQCKSWYVCRATGNFHSSDEDNNPMNEYVTETAYNDLCLELLNYYIEINEHFKQHPGQIIVLENRDNPYTFNKADIHSTQWPTINDTLLQQFNNLDIIKRSYNEAIS